MRKPWSSTLTWAYLVTGCAFLAACTTSAQAPNLGERLTPSTSVSLSAVTPTADISPCDGFTSNTPAANTWQQLSFECLADGTTMSGSQFRGKPTVAVVWASWCGPCRKELPILAHYALSQKSVRVVGLGWKDQPAALQAYAQEIALPFPTLLDRNAALERALNIHSQPTLILLNSDAHVVHIERAPVDSIAHLRTLVATYL